MVLQRICCLLLYYPTFITLSCDAKTIFIKTFISICINSYSNYLVKAKSYFESSLSDACPSKQHSAFFLSLGRWLVAAAGARAMMQPYKPTDRPPLSFAVFTVFTAPATNELNEPSNLYSMTNPIWSVKFFLQSGNVNVQDHYHVEV